jgi:hypothetical protein
VGTPALREGEINHDTTPDELRLELDLSRSRRR